MTANPSTPKNGHGPTLAACFLHFDLSFMLWVLLGALGVFAAESAGLRPAQKGIMVAIPILSGSLMRIPVGLLSDRFGGKRVGVALLSFLFIPLAIGFVAARSFPSLMLLGMLLGAGGASFAVALPLASRWYPPERQGLAMGIAAAGNSGTVLTNLVAPRLALKVGWHAVFGLAALPLVAVLVAFLLLAKESPHPRLPSRSPLRLLNQSELWYLCLFYCVTFGGFVGLSSFLPIFFRDQYAVSPISAGTLTAVGAVAGSIARPFGGHLADRMGGSRLLLIVLGAVAMAYFFASLLLPLPAVAMILVMGMAFLGLGNGAVFQLVAQRLGREIGAATGIIGAVGGFGGFLLPTLLGAAKQWTGSFGAGLLAFSALAAIALVTLVWTRKEWHPVPVEVEA